MANPNLGGSGTPKKRGLFQKIGKDIGNIGNTLAHPFRHGKSQKPAPSSAPAAPAKKSASPTAPMKAKEKMGKGKPKKKPGGMKPVTMKGYS